MFAAGAGLDLSHSVDLVDQLLWTLVITLTLRDQSAHLRLNVVHQPTLGYPRPT